MSDKTPSITSTSGRKPQGSAYWEIARDENKDWHICLWSANGRPIVTNIVPISNSTDCKKVIRQIQAMVPSANVVYQKKEDEVEEDGKEQTAEASTEASEATQIPQALETTS